MQRINHDEYSLYKALSYGGISWHSEIFTRVDTQVSLPV